jgi:hypothetical protein
MSTSLWDDPTLACFDGIFDHLSIILSDFIDFHFGRFKELERYMRYDDLFAHFLTTWLMNLSFRQLIVKEAEQRKELAFKAVQKALELEKTPLFTQNLQVFDFEKTEWLRRYEYIHENPHDSYSGRGSYCSNCSGYCRPVTPTRSTEFREPLEVMADVRAYFEVAYRVCSPCR